MLNYFTFHRLNLGALGDFSAFKEDGMTLSSCSWLFLIWTSSSLDKGLQVGVVLRGNVK